jgi:hypothetical protein
MDTDANITISTPGTSIALEPKARLVIMPLLEKEASK